MKITVYTVNECQFSKEEKEYLTSHNLPFAEKNLEQNKDWLTEMLAVSNNFAGTPVTKIERDDGQIVVSKGFTKEELEKELGLSSTPTSPPPPPPVAEPPPIPTVIEPPPATDTGTPPAQPEPPAQPPPPTPEQPQSPPVPVAPTNQLSQDPQLTSILNDLQSKSNQPTTQQSPASSLPSIPEPNFG